MRTEPRTLTITPAAGTMLAFLALAALAVVGLPIYEKYDDHRRVGEIRALLVKPDPGLKVTAREGMIFFTPPQKDALHTNDGEICIPVEVLEKESPPAYEMALKLVKK